MARETVQNDLKTCCDLGIPPRPLIVPIMDPLAVHLAGVSYSDYSTSAQAMAEVWGNAIERFDLDWAGLLVDDLFEYEPLGIEVTNAPDLPFAVENYLPATPDTLNSLRLPDPNRAGRMPAILEAQQRLRERWGRCILIAGSTAAPFSGLTLLYGIQETLLLLYDDPAFLHRSMGFLEELAIAWGTAMVEGGADVIWLGDCSASSRFIPLNVYREFALQPAKRVAVALREAGATVVYHAGENRVSYLEAMAGTGAQILSVESGVDMAAVKEAVADRICLMGNLDPLNLLWHGTPAEIEATVHRLVTYVASKGGYIVNVGENTPEQTPPQNVETMIRCIRAAWEHLDLPPANRNPYSL